MDYCDRARKVHGRCGKVRQARGEHVMQEPVTEEWLWQVGRVVWWKVRVRQSRAGITVSLFISLQVAAVVVWRLWESVMWKDEGRSVKE